MSSRAPARTCAACAPWPACDARGNRPIDAAARVAACRKDRREKLVMAGTSGASYAQFCRRGKEDVRRMTLVISAAAALAYSGASALRPTGLAPEAAFSGGIMRKRLTAGAILLAAALVFAGARPAAAAACVDCHKKTTPGIVTDWQLSKHSQNDVDCAVCHGDAHTSAADVAKVKIPTPATCQACHEKQVAQFNNGKHALAWLAMKAMPSAHAQPVALMDSYKGCGGCHQIGHKICRQNLNLVGINLRYFNIRIFAPGQGGKVFKNGGNQWHAAGKGEFWGNYADLHTDSNCCGPRSASAKPQIPGQVCRRI